MLQSLGKIVVTTGGTPVQVSSKNVQGNSFLWQAVPTNTGKVYVGLSTLNRTNLTGVLGIIAVPTLNIIPSFSVTIARVPTNLLDLFFIWLDVDVNGEGAVFSYLQL